MSLCTLPEAYYDLNVLSRQTLPIDAIIQRMWERYRYKIQGLTRPNRVWKDWKNVTPELVDALKAQGYDHIVAVRKRPSQYGYLHYVQRKNREWYNAVQMEYEAFPLMTDREKVLEKVRALASKLKPEKDETNLICLHLLYFYGLLANPGRNWVMMDYLTNGNVFHPYGTLLYEKWVQEGTMK